MLPNTSRRAAAGGALAVIVLFAYLSMSRVGVPPEHAGGVLRPAFEHDVSSVVVVVAHDGTSLEWLKHIPYSYVVVGPSEPGGPKAEARDAASFLSFLVEYFDVLPPRLIFLRATDSVFGVISSQVAPRGVCGEGGFVWGREQPRVR